MVAIFYIREAMLSPSLDLQDNIAKNASHWYPLKKDGCHERRWGATGALWRFFRQLFV